jgi:hypothetical protein
MRRIGMNLAWLGHGIVLTTLAGCGSERVTETPVIEPANGGAAPATNAPTNPVDLATVMRRTHFGYRTEGREFTGGHDTYAVKASTDGVKLWPINGSRLGAPEDSKIVPFVAALDSVSRGEKKIETTASAAKVRDDQSLSIVRGSVVEHLENTEDGVEQSFEFATRPAGSGDLDVKIAVTGESFVGETEHGLHFVDPATGIGVRYGVATWVDAQGTRTQVEADFVEGRIVLHVPEAVLETSAYPAVLDPVIGPEIAIDTPVYVPSNSDQQDTVMSFAGGNFLVAWTDYRYAANTDVYGVRVSSAGTILDTSGIPIGVAKGSQFAPTIATNGTDWMVAWRDTRTNATGDIYAARVNAAGVVQDPTGIAVSTGGNREMPAIAFDGTNYFVAYLQSAINVRGNFVGANGVVNPSQTNISSLPFSVNDIALGWNGTNYLAAFTVYSGSTFYRIGGRRMNPAGSVLDAADIYLCNNASNCGYAQVSLASDGVNWLVVWDSYGASNQIIGGRLSAAGALLDPLNGFVIGSGAANQDPLGLTVAFAGNGYGVFWDDQTQVYGARVSSGGAVLVPATVATNEMGSRAYPAAAHDGTNFLVAFQDSRDPNGNDIYGLRVSNALVKVDATSTLLSRQANAERNPKMAYNGTNWLAVWEDFRPTSDSDVYGARLSNAGTVLDPAGIAISTATGSQFSLSVAANGADWLVAWRDDRNGSATDDIYATRVSSTGSVLDPMGISVNASAGYQTSPAVSADGTNWLVVWRDINSTEIRGARVAPNATVLDAASFQISTGGGNLPAIAYNGTNYFVVWTKATNSGDIFGSRVTPGRRCPR